MIAKAMGIPIADLPDDNEGFITDFLHEVRTQAIGFCPNKAKPYEEIEYLVDEDIIANIVTSLRSVTNQPFIRDSGEQIAKLSGSCGSCGTGGAGEEVSLEEGGKDFMIGRLVVLATKRCDLFKKMKGNEFAKIFENEKKVPIPSIFKQSVLNKKRDRHIYLNAKLQFIIGLTAKEGKGFNPRMASLITQIIAVKGREKVYQGNLTLPMANKYLWGAKSLFHKCIMHVVPQFDLGFYQNGSPHTAWRVGKIVTESSLGGGAAEYGNDEDQYFEKAFRDDDTWDEEMMEPASMATFK
jgi:hypothetical protein